ncbi:lysylphosphatidylglycerol synthase transmembrane domain-containing protein [Williamsia sterculiae]|uniref:Lysylphosphatidylglycerol synthase TM region n=1 Tax=Williamsia sterculiae TaxID=1344003 RepID=A0A1N7CCM7_9NOCA|nr:YbhN family protein [Williamsia sterculiae]SIR61330.1 hypothetical protein SAMN05445060_0039 [Williamsia sterculiae]
MTAEHADAEGAGQHTRRRRFWWVRWVALALAIAVLAVEAVLIWPSLQDAWHRKDNLRGWWIVPCIIAAGLSMDSFAQVQRALLRSAGVVVKQWKSLSVVLAANSVSQTLPGGQVLAPAFTYRETRKWGASPVVASWQVVMSGLLMGVGLAVLGLGGALLAGAKTSPFSVLFSVFGFIAFVIVAQYLAGHPETMENVGLRLLRWYNEARDKPEDHGATRWVEIIEQLRAVQLTGRDAAVAFGWSIFNWAADVACLAFACYAVGAQPSISGLMVAYAAGKAVGTAIPLLPGGLGVVDGVLVPALASAGMGGGEAVTAVLLYRLVSYLLVALIGWLVIFAKFRREIRSDDDPDREHRARGSSGADRPVDDPPDRPHTSD